MDDKSETRVLLSSSTFSRKTEVVLDDEDLHGDAPGLDEDDVDLVSSLLAELISCYMLIFLGLGAVYVSAIVTFDVVTTDRVLYIALGYGMVFSAVIYAFSYPAADARAVPNVRHLNPVMTFILFLTGRFGIGKTLLYWLAQITGSGLAVVSIYYCTPLSKKDILTPYPTLDGLKEYQFWVMELIISSFALFGLLMTNFASVAWKKQPAIQSSVNEDTRLTNHELNCLTSGFIIFSSVYAAGPFSGGYTNPLFAIGIGILSGTYRASSIAAPFASGVVALLLGLLFGFEFDWGIKRYFNKRKEKNSA